MRLRRCLRSAIERGVAEVREKVEQNQRGAIREIDRGGLTCVADKKKSCTVPPGFLPIKAAAAYVARRTRLIEQLYSRSEPVPPVLGRTVKRSTDHRSACAKRSRLG